MSKLYLRLLLEIWHDKAYLLNKLKQKPSVIQLKKTEKNVWFVVSIMNEKESLECIPNQFMKTNIGNSLSFLLILHRKFDRVFDCLICIYGYSLKHDIVKHTQ